MDASLESGCAVVSGYALREVATSVRVSCCRRALFEELLGDGLVLPFRASAGIKGGWMTLHSRRVISVCESRCDWFRRAIIEAVLCELTRCWSVLASRCRRSSGPGVVGLASCQSCLFVITIVCDQERCLLQEAGEHALIRHVWEGRHFG